LTNAVIFCHLTISVACNFLIHTKSELKIPEIPDACFCLRWQHWNVPILTPNIMEAYNVQQKVFGVKEYYKSENL
jgi:hypothetical protein